MFIARVLRSLCVGLVLFAPCAGLTKSIAATTVIVIPKPDFSSMTFLVGTWSCSKQNSARPLPYTAMETFAVSPDRRWIELTTLWNPVPWFPNKWTSHDEITYDQSKKRWVDVEYDDIGGSGRATSPGWSGNMIVWHDPDSTPTTSGWVTTDDTMTKVSDSRVMSEWSLINQKKHKTETEKTVCTKT